MFRQILYVHWRAVRLPLLPFAVAAFGLPLLSVQGLGGMTAGAASPLSEAWFVFDVLQFWLPAFPALAAANGTVIGFSAWMWDLRGEHAYALSLPISRARYALLKMGAGALLLGVPAIAFAVGALAATASVSLPEGLHAYPLLLTTRFVLAMLLTYALLFALASGNMRNTMIVVTVLGVGVVLADLTADWLVELNQLEGWSLTQWLLERLVRWPGPFEVFSGNWMLIDV